MLFNRFKLQLPKNFRKGVPVAQAGDDICACGCPASAHSSATLRKATLNREPDDVRVDIRWRACKGDAVVGTAVVGKCRCPGFWKAS